MKRYDIEVRCTREGPLTKQAVLEELIWKVLGIRCKLKPAPKNKEVKSIEAESKNEITV